jgi:molybdenum cofactor guanylyltransferase
LTSTRPNPALYDRTMQPAASPIAAFILAGGKSTRMGIDKAFVPLHGRTLLERALETAHSVTPNVHIVGDRTKFAPFGPVIEDIFPGCGPLGGIHAALRTSRFDVNLILAVDVPFASPTLLKYLVRKAIQSPALLITVPSMGQGLQPLCAVYRREFAERAENALGSGRYKIDALFDPSQTQMITEEELSAAGFSSNAFRNLNTPEELEEATREMSQ